MAARALESSPHKSRRTSFRTLKFLSPFPHVGLLTDIPPKPSSDYLDRYRLAIVCSARSGSTKSLGTTNLLLRAASEALQRSPQVCSPAQSGAASPVITPFIYRESSRGYPTGTVGVLADQNAESLSFNKTVDLIHSEHIAAARDCVNGQAILSELEAEIDGNCENLRAFLYAAQVRIPR